MEKALLPAPDNRLTAVGMTGSGKTHFMLWHLWKFMANYSFIPAVIIDFKGDDFNEINGKREGYKIPKHGKRNIFIVQPELNEGERLSKFLWDIKSAGGILVFCDEVRMIKELGATEAYRALLTQGRSRLIPMFSGVQRPVFVDQFVFSEASFIQMFHLLKKSDYDTINENIPELPEYAFTLPLRESIYFDTIRQSVHHFAALSMHKEQIVTELNRLISATTRKI